MQDQIKHRPIYAEGHLLKPDFKVGEIAFYSGEHADKALSYLIEEVSYKPDDHLRNIRPRYQLPKDEISINKLGLCCGYFQDKEGKWIAFDNSTGECFVEDFSTEELCIEYLGLVDPEIIIREFEESVIELYDRNDKYIGTIDNQITFLDVRLQIKEKELEGYYFFFIGEKVTIDKDGGLPNYPKNLYDHTRQMLNQLLGI